MEGQSAKGGDSSLGERQRKDPELLHIIQYLESGVLPEDERRAREIALTHSQYSIVDQVLYYIERDKTLRVIPATSDRKRIFDEAHSETLGGHLRDAKIHGQSAYTIARMLVEKVVPKHGVPAQLLSDRGAAFLSKLLAEVYS